MARNNKPSPKEREAGENSGSMTRHKTEPEKSGEAGKFSGKPSEKLEKRLKDKGDDTHGEHFKNRDNPDTGQEEAQP